MLIEIKYNLNNKMLNKIKQLAQDVFKELGSGYSEEIYEKAKP